MTDPTTSEPIRAGDEEATTPDESDTVAIRLPASFHRRLETLALRHERSVAELVQLAVDVQYGDDAVTARLRLVDRLARLEARLGNVDTLLDEVSRASRLQRERLHE